MPGSGVKDTPPRPDAAAFVLRTPMRSAPRISSVTDTIAWRNTLEIIAQRNPAVKVDMNIGKYLDESIVDELEREGFFKKLTGKG